MMLMNLCQQKGLAYAINGRDGPWPLKVYFREKDNACHYQHHCINLSL